MAHFKIILAFLLSFCVTTLMAQQYTPMTAAGYAMKRVKVDSTLHLPSFCGTPTLRNSTAINGALAMDTCNNKLYKWTNQAGWSVVGDMQDLQSVLDKGETAFGREIDLYNNSGNNELLLSPKYDNGMPFIGMADSTGRYFWISLTGTPNLTFQNKNKSQVLIQQDSIGGVVYLPTQSGETDTLATLGDVRNVTFDTISLSNRINLKVNITDTASMLLPYLKIIDTSNKWVSSVTKLNDSTIQVIKDGTTTNITLTPTSTVTSATRLVTQVYNNSGVTITKGSVIYINGRHSSNLPTIALAQANTEQNSYSTFALVLDDIATSNSGTVVQAGSITNLNLPTSSFSDGQLVYLSPTVAGGITTTKPLAPYHIVKIGTITRAHPTFGTIELKIENGWQLDEMSDVQIPVVPNDSNLLQFSRVDSLWHSVSPTTAIGSRYIQPSDTASMLSPYQRANDAVTLNTTQTISAQKTWTELNIHEFNALGTTQDANKGIRLINTTSGTSGVPVQISPALTFNSNAWNPTAGASQNAYISIYSKPISQNTPTAQLSFASSSNGGAYNEFMNISGGGITWTGNGSFNMTSGNLNALTVNATGVNPTLKVTGAQAIATTQKYSMVVENTTAATAGVPVQYSPSTKITGNGWNTTSLASHAADFRYEVRPVSANPITSNLVFGAQINGGGYTDLFTINNGGNITITGNAKIQAQGITPNLQFGTTGLFNGNWVTQSGKFRINSSGYQVPTYPFSIGNSNQTAASGVAKIAEIGGTLIAAANNDTLVGVDIQPTFTNGAFTGVINYAARLQGMFNIRVPSVASTREQIIQSSVTDATNDGFFVNNGTLTDAQFAPSFGGLMSTANNLWALNFTGFVSSANDASNSSNFGLIDFNATRTDNVQNPFNGTLSSVVNRRLFTFRSGSNYYMTLFPSGNLALNTTTDAGYKLDVNGTTRIQNKLSVGTPTATTAIMEITSTTQGFLPPRMTTTQRDAISSPAAGLIIYNTTTNKHQGYNGTTWNDFY